MEMNSTVIMIAAFVGVFGLIAALGVLLKEMSPTTAEDRLAVLTGQKSVSDKSGGVMKKQIVAEGAKGISTAIGRAAEKVGDVNLFFQQADSPITFETFLLMSLGTGGLAFVIGIIAKAPFLLLPICALVGLVGPYFWLSRKRQKRFKAFAKQMPDAMELISRALRSGHSLSSSMHVVIEEMPAPLSTEFSAAYEQQKLGIPMERSLRSMLTRMPNMDLKFFVTAIAIQKQAGGDLAEILDKISYVIRERFKIMGQVQALTGEGRISGVVLMALPIVLFFAVYYLNPPYVMTLFTHPTGRKMIAVAIFLQILGAWSIKKIINIKV